MKRSRVIENELAAIRSVIDVMTNSNHEIVINVFGLFHSCNCLLSKVSTLPLDHYFANLVCPDHKTTLALHALSMLYSNSRVA